MKISDHNAQSSQFELDKTGFQCICRKIWKSVFESFQCPQGVNPLLFSHFCVYYYTEVHKTLEIRVGHRINKNESNQSTDQPKKKPKYLGQQDGFLGHIQVVDKQQTMCILINSMINVLGKVVKILKQPPCLEDQVDHHNLLMDIVVSWCLANSKAKLVPVILLNTNNYNIFLW